MVPVRVEDGFHGIGSQPSPSRRTCTLVKTEHVCESVVQYCCDGFGPTDFVSKDHRRKAPVAVTCIEQEGKARGLDDTAIWIAHEIILFPGSSFSWALVCRYFPSFRCSG